ncbi:uncharacterized protein [Diadema setosum]|uniref:uncharacterized protein n=1 Tax=Diadema setosum TaxID=31175 RepID=UPI003B3A3F59
MEEEGNLSQLRMQELRQKCEELGLSHEGLNRNQLIKNIEEAKEEQASPLPSAPVMSTDKNTTQNTAARTESDTMEEARMQFELEKMRMQVRLAELENAKLEIERKGTNAGSFGVDGGIRRMPMYKEGEDVDVFLRAFEKMAQLNEWPREAYRVKFRELKVDRDETYTEFSVKLTDLLGRWLQGAGALNDLDRLKEEILKEQMLKQVPFDLRVWLRDHEPDTLGDMARLADQYVISRKGAGKPQGHWGKAGPNHSPKPGWNSGSGGGKGESKPNPQQNKKQNEDRGNYRAKVRCYTCDKFGHIAVNCPNAHKSEVQAEKKGNDKSKEHGPTYFCRPEPHPKLKPYISDARLGDRHVRLLRDSGCTHSLARSDVVDPTFIIPGETVKMRGLFSKKEVPIARVHLISEPYGIKKWIHVGLVDEIEVDVLLGNEVLDENDPDLDIPDYVSRKEAGLVVTRNQAREKELKEEQTRAEVIRSKVQVRDLFGENEQGEAADSGNDDDEREEGAHEVNDVNDVHDDDTTVGTGESDTTSDKAANGEQPQGEKILPTHLDIGRKELIQAQQDDPSLKSVWEKVEKKEGNEGRCHFYVENGVLMREWSGNSKSESSEVYTQIVVPKGYRTRLLEVAHDNLTAGHLGVGKTQQRLMQNFYWPGIFRDVSEFCKTCGPCQKCASQTRGISKAKLVSVPVIGSPFRKIAIDIVGPLPRSKKGNRYILVVCDYATRHPEAVPLPSIEAERVADELIRIFSRVGIPHELLSDQGSNFMSLLMKQLCSSLGIKQIRTSPYHPQANGLVERFNATLKDMLKPYTLEGNVTWDDLIPYVLFAYREVPQESTGFSPFELLYGHRVRGPLDVIREAWLGETVPEEGLVSYVLNCRERSANITTAAQKNLAQAQKRQKAWYDRKARTKDLQVGDKVLVLLPSSSNKLLAKWQGPYPVIQKLSDVNYVVEMGDKRKKHRVFHTNMLRVWREREECVMYTDVDDGNDDEYLDQFIEPLTQRGTSKFNDGAFCMSMGREFQNLGPT